MACQIIDQIREHINNRNNFLLSGGAGSGKNIYFDAGARHYPRKDPIANIACITYTNVAADEIKARSALSEIEGIDYS